MSNEVETRGCEAWLERMSRSVEQGLSGVPRCLRAPLLGLGIAAGFVTGVAAMAQGAAMLGLPVDEVTPVRFAVAGVLLLGLGAWLYRRLRSRRS